MILRKSQKEREIALTQALQQDYTRLFMEVARALTSTLELEIVLNTVMSKMAQFFGPERWSMMLVDKERNDLYYVIAVGENSRSLEGLRVPMGQGVAGWVALTGNPMVVPDTSIEPRWIEFSRQHPGLDVHSIACVPIRSAEGVVGVIQLLNAKIDLLSDYSIQFLRVLCDFSAIAVRNAADMKRIHVLSIKDDCTGLYNARHLYTMLEAQLAEANVQPFSLLFLDLDHFKSVNDTYGHLIGSRLLAEVGALVRKIVGPEAAAFRYGGDEFVVLLPGQNKVEGTITAKRLYCTLRTTPFLQDAGLALRLQGSFGLATFPDDGTDIEKIIRAADAMMYHVKGTTRDNLAVAGLGLLFDGEEASAENFSGSAAHKQVTAAQTAISPAGPATAAAPVTVPS